MNHMFVLMGSNNNKIKLLCKSLHEKLHDHDMKG